MKDIDAEDVTKKSQEKIVSANEKVKSLARHMGTNKV